MKWKELNQEYTDLLEGYKTKNPYEILRVDPSASIQEIRKAYKKLVRTYHPDASDIFMRTTNEEIIKRINLAYRQILKERDGN